MDILKEKQNVREYEDFEAFSAKIHKSTSFLRTIRARVFVK